MTAPHGDSGVTTIPPLVIAVDRDEDDRIWLERQINTLAAGLKAAYAACMEVTKNWNAGRRIGRLYPEYAEPGTFLLEYVGQVRLAREERDDFIRALVAGGTSRRKAAMVVGADAMTAVRAVRGVPNATRPPRPREDPPIDPDSDATWDALLQVMGALAAFTANDVARVAATVPDRRRAATARKLRKLGRYLGGIAWTLEGSIVPGDQP